MLDAGYSIKKGQKTRLRPTASPRQAEDRGFRFRIETALENRKASPMFD
jgi:hypothetical protein